MSFKFFKKTPPLTGGNTLTANELLHAQHTYNKATMNLPLSKTALDTDNMETSLNGIFAGKNYDIWRLLMFLGDYFINMYAFRTSSNVLLSQLNLLKRVCWIYGNAGIYKMGLKSIPLCITKIEYSNSLIPIYVEAIPAQQVLSAKAQSHEQLAKMTKMNFVIRGDDLKNLVVWQWDDLGYGAIYKVLPFIQQQSEMLEMIYTNSFSFIRKKVFNVGAKDKLTSDIKNWFNTKLPFFMKKEGDGILDSNKVENMELRGSGSEQDILEYYVKWLNVWNEIIGRKRNLQQKKERNLSQEVKIDDDYFDTLHLPTLQNMICFAKEVVALFGINVQVVEVGYDY